MAAKKTAVRAKAEEGPEPNDVLDALMNRINAKAKHRVIGRAEDVPTPFFGRKPSGIMQLDIDTGGGLPDGGLCVLSGAFGGGKTTLLNNYYRMQQRLRGDDARLALATVEFPPDHLYMRSRGVEIAVPDTTIQQLIDYRKQMKLAPFVKADIQQMKHQVGRFDIVTGATAEETLQATLDMFRTGLYNMFGIDSISVMLPDADQGKEMDKNSKQAGNATLVTDFMKKWHPLTLGLDRKQNNTTLVLIAQVRSNSAKASAPSYIAKFLPDTVQTGAEALKHGKLIDIMVRSGEALKKSDGTKTGKMMCWSIVKGKAGTHEGIQGEVEYDYKAGIDFADTVFIEAAKLGVLVERKDGKKSSGFEFIRPSTGEVLEDGTVTKTQILEMLETDPSFEKRLRLEVLYAKGIECSY